MRCVKLFLCRQEKKKQQVVGACDVPLSMLLLALRAAREAVDVEPNLRLVKFVVYV